jgi:hypothetical protein
MKSFVRHAWSVVTLPLLLAALSGCGVVGVHLRADYNRQMRYSYTPQQVRIGRTQSGEFALADAQGQQVRRPWRMVGTFKSPFAPLTGAGRALGCDAVWQATQVSTQSGVLYNTLRVTWFEGTIHGVPFSQGDQGCIEYVDARAEQQRRRESHWVWTAYQRPALDSGVSINFNVPLDFGANSYGQAFTGIYGSVEKYFRNFPFGFGVRYGTQVLYQHSRYNPTDSTRALQLPGVLLFVPVITLWRLQLTAVGGFEFAFSFPNNQFAWAPRFGGGGYLDFVTGRYWMIGIGAEYWASLNEAAAPSSFIPSFRFGFPF